MCGIISIVFIWFGRENIMEFTHKSVLLDECISGLNIRPDGIYLDGTLGGAGHSLAIVQKLTTGRLIGVDQDMVALDAASARLAQYMDRVTLVHGNFRELNRILADLEIPAVDGMLFLLSFYVQREFVYR